MGKVVALSTAVRALAALRKNKQKVVFTNGCFDILHAGHVRYLKKARSLGDCLVLGLNSDASVRKIKGRGRPIVPQLERAEIMAALEAVDYVVIFAEPTPIKLIKAIRPDVLVKGADWKRGEIVGEEVLKGYGGRVARVKLVEGRSTTNTIKKILKVCK